MTFDDLAAENTDFARKVSMCLCMCLRVYVFMGVCMYACMYGCMYKYYFVSLCIPLILLTSLFSFFCFLFLYHYLPLPLPLPQAFGNEQFDGMASKIETGDDADSEKKGKKLFNYGFLNFFKSGEYHHNNQPLIKTLHSAIRSHDLQLYNLYEQSVKTRPPTTLRDALEFGQCENDRFFPYLIYNTLYYPQRHPLTLSHPFTHPPTLTSHSFAAPTKRQPIPSHTVTHPFTPSPFYTLTLSLPLFRSSHQTPAHPLSHRHSPLYTLTLSHPLFCTLTLIQTPSQLPPNASPSPFTPSHPNPLSPSHALTLIKTPSQLLPSASPSPWTKSSQPKAS